MSHSCTSFMFPEIQCAAAILAVVFSSPAEAYVLADRLVAGECNVPAPIALDFTAVPAPMVNELLDWIAANTGYEVSGVRAQAPQIGFCRTGDTIPYESDTAIVDETLNGAYDWPNHRIILVRPWDPGNPYDRSVLLHELVHAVQLANRIYECPQQPEWEAYKLQDAYLAEHDIVSAFDWLQIYFRSKCPRDIHP